MCLLPYGLIWTVWNVQQEASDLLAISDGCAVPRNTPPVPVGVEYGEGLVFRQTVEVECGVPNDPLIVVVVHFAQATSITRTALNTARFAQFE